jgi:phosphate transport system substrate-binding protein
MVTVTRRWAEGCGRFHPRGRFEWKLVGSGAAMPGIYHNVADLALLGRESDITDDNGFFKSVGGYKPLRLELMNGSLDAPGESSAPVIFVHKDNPLSKATVAQLEAVFGHEHRRSTENIRTWGQLGLTGEWTDKPIRLYAYDIESEDGLHFVDSVLAESRKLNWENLSEFRDIKGRGGDVVESGRQIVDALKKEIATVLPSPVRPTRMPGSRRSPSPRTKVPPMSRPPGRASSRVPIRLRAEPTPS